MLHDMMSASCDACDASDGCVTAKHASKQTLPLTTRCIQSEPACTDMQNMLHESYQSSLRERIAALGTLLLLLLVSCAL